LLKSSVKVLFCKTIFQSAQHLYEKREESGSVPLTNGSGSGSPKLPFIYITFAGADNEDTPQYKLTGFTVYDKAGHAVPFDTDLIESGKEIFFSGFLKNVFAEVTLSTH
jgi:hypothetical protein